MQSNIAPHDLTYNPNEIKDVADIETVAGYLGLDMRRKGKRISILCPCHEDHNHGSCFISEGGFRCYSCGASGDVISLTQAVNKCSFTDACEYIANIYGIKPNVEQKYRRKKKLLNPGQLNLIGLLAESEKVYIDKAIIDDPVPPDFELEPGQRLKWVPANSESERDYYVLQEAVTFNPLRDLLETNESEYHALICRKASEAEEMYRDMLCYVQNPAKFFTEREHTEKTLLMMHCVEHVCSEVGISMWIREMEMRIRLCENLSIEHSNAQTKPAKRDTIALGSVFGKLKSSGISL